MTPNLEMSLDDPVSTVWRIVGLPVRLTLTQSREVRGRFECVDHLHNVILSDAEEHTMVHRDDGTMRTRNDAVTVRNRDMLVFLSAARLLSCYVVRILIENNPFSMRRQG